jgi:hypothetical protein
MFTALDPVDLAFQFVISPTVDLTKPPFDMAPLGSAWRFANQQPWGPRLEMKSTA